MTPTRAETPSTQPPQRFWTEPRTWLVVLVLLGAHLTLAISSLVTENPTIDEVAHLPAGLTYLEQGTFRLYPHNPPLLKLAAALAARTLHPDLERIYKRPSWRSEPPVTASVAHEFAFDNAPRYFEIFERARMVTPAFSVLGGLVIFLWSRRLHGEAGGLLSLALWCFGPNVLAHARLITSDIGATALGVAATFAFWCHLQRPSWWRAALAGLMLGLALLAKFSNLILLALWPALWLVDQLARDRRDLPKSLLRAIRHAPILLAITALTINIGYGFEGTFRSLGSYEFASGSLTRPTKRGGPTCSNELLNLAWRHRVNRFRGTPLQALPVPLPEYFLIGFDLQKLEAEGIPRRFIDASAPEGEIIGYPVYLNGVLRSTGWWYYYLAALAYKVPEGIWALFALACWATLATARTRAAWSGVLTLALVPLSVLFAMSFGTDINLGLRYILPAFPYIFIGIGAVVPWGLGMTAKRRRAAFAAIGASLLATFAATLGAHPHYLAYFNAASGGTTRGSEHLIDSNLDWGQDLIGLRNWIKANAPSERIGLAYFGQINPNIFALRGEGFDWFLAPPLPETTRATRPLDELDGPPASLVPGLYAISASFLRGLPYTMYDSSLRVPNLYPGWDSRGSKRSDVPAFGYFQRLTPIDRIGGSIFIYRVSPDDAARLAPLWGPP